MKHKIKKFITFSLKKTLPRYSYEWLKHYYAFLRCPHKNIFEKNKSLEGAGYGKRAFLLATGPSINKEDLTLLEGEDCYSVSNFFLHKHINIIRPKIHFFAPYHKPLTLESYIEWMKLAHKQLPKETCIALSQTTKNQVEQYNLFTKRNVFYFYFAILISIVPVAPGT